MNQDVLQAQKEFIDKCLKQGEQGFFDADKRKEWSSLMVLGLICEVAEFIEAYNPFPWKNTTTTEIEVMREDHIKEELVDIMFFLLEMCLLYGIDSEEVLKDLYFRKLKVNYERGQIHEKPNPEGNL